MAARLTTEKRFISEPVAGRVSTVPRGTVALTLAREARMSQGSPRKGMAAAMNFVPSMTEPPPTARRKSTCSRRARSTARIRVS